MRRLLGSLLLCLLSSFSYGACDSTTPPTYTPNVGLAQPVINACNWGTTLNNDLLIIDSSFTKTSIVVPSINPANRFSIPFYSATGSSNTLSAISGITTDSSQTDLNISGALTVSGLAANQCVQTTTGGLLTTTGALCGSGSGGGSTNGTIVASPQFQLPYYSLTGTTTTLTGLSGVITDGAGAITASTVTGNAGMFGNSASTVGPSGSSAFHGSYVAIRSSGTTQGLLIDGRGEGPSPQTQQGLLTVRTDANNDSGLTPTPVVIVDSNTDSTAGNGLLEIWENNPNHNSYLLWIHGSSPRNSDEPIRFDGPTWGIDEVNTANTGTSNGLGKWKVISSALGSSQLQLASSRSWDNTTFENMLYVQPFTTPGVQPAGLYVQAQSLANDSGVLSSSDTSVVAFQSQNNHTVGITGPLNPTASYTFGLPKTFNNQGQVLYQVNNGRGNNNNAFDWGFSVGGSSQQVLTNGGTGAPYWSTVNTSTTLASGSTNYIQNTSVLQSGSTFYVSSGTVNGSLLVATTLYANTLSNAPGNSWNLQLNDGFVTGNALSVVSSGINGTSLTFEDVSTAQTSIQHANGMTYNGNSIWLNTIPNANPVLASGLNVSASPTVPYALLVDTNLGGPYFLQVSTQGWIIIPGSTTILGSGGLGVINGITGGSGTFSNLTNGQCVQAGTNGLLTTTGAPCGTGGGGGSSALQVTQGGVQITSPTASLNFSNTQFSIGAIGSTSTIAMQQISLSTSAIGTLQAAQEPAHTGDVTNTAGSLNLVSSALQPNITTFSSSITVTGAGGINNSFGIVTSSVSASSITVAGPMTAASYTVNNGVNTGVIFQNGQTYATTSSFEWNGTTMSATRVSAGTMTATQFLNDIGSFGANVTYGINVGSMTGAGLTSCSGGSNALTWNSITNQFGCNTISGGSGSGIVSPGTFTWVNNFGINLSTAVINTEIDVPYVSSTSFIGIGFIPPLLMANGNAVQGVPGTGYFNGGQGSTVYISGNPDVISADDILDVSALSTHTNDQYAAQFRNTGVNSNSTTHGVKSFSTPNSSGQTGYALEGKCIGSGTSTCYGLYGEASGAGSANTAGFFTASGATTNVGLQVASGEVIIQSSQVVTGAGGLGVTYGVIAGSVTASNLPSGQCVQTTTGGLLTTTGSACGSGGGSSPSPLAVGTGTVAGFAFNASSPTSILNFNGSQFTAQLTGSATAFIGLNPSSVTLQGQNVAILTATQTFTGAQNITGSLSVTSATVANAGNLHGIFLDISNTPTSASSATVTGIFSEADWLGSTVTTSKQQALFGVEGVADIFGSAGIPFANGGFFEAVNNSTNAITTRFVGVEGIAGNNAGTIPTAVGVYAQSVTSVGATNTNNYGLYVAVSSQGISGSPDGTIINNYGVYVDTQTGNSKNYGIYQVPSGGQNQLSTTTFVNPVSIVSNANINIVSISTITNGATIFSISSATAVNTNDYLVNISSVTGSVIFGVQNNSHVVSSGTVPSLTSCGSSPSIVGTDAEGTVTGGTGAAGCTITFSAPYANDPSCIVQPQTESIVNAYSYTHSSTAITFTQTGFGTGKLDYHCWANKG